MGFESTTLRNLVRCSNYWASGDSMASDAQIDLIPSGTRIFSEFVLLQVFTLDIMLFSLWRVHLADRI